MLCQSSTEKTQHVDYTWGGEQSTNRKSLLVCGVERKKKKKRLKVCEIKRFAVDKLYLLKKKLGRNLLVAITVQCFKKHLIWWYLYVEDFFLLKTPYQGLLVCKWDERQLRRGAPSWISKKDEENPYNYNSDGGMFSMDKILTTKIKDGRTRSKLLGKISIESTANQVQASKDKQAGWVKELQTNVWRYGTFEKVHVQTKGRLETRAGQRQRGNYGGGQTCLD